MHNGILQVGYRKGKEGINGWCGFIYDEKVECGMWKGDFVGVSF